METNLEKELIAIFKHNKKYWDNNILNRTAIVNDLKVYDSTLINSLIDNDIVAKNYVLDINGVKILKIDELISFLRYKKYWQDSYTKYTNKIGLSSENRFLEYNDDVVLDFPYKDCMLEGGMSKEDIGKDEIFYNNIIARDEIDTLLSPKIFNNIKRYDKNGESEVNSIQDDDNLIIKGNNLIALSSLLEKYRGKVDLIFIDPPYNTDKDSFKYNDKFTRSTWLSYMKTRLELSRLLLNETGTIYISLDFNQVHYLKVLMDSIFGEDCFLNDIAWQYYMGGKKDNTFARKHDQILMYSKVKDNNYFNKLKIKRYLDFKPSLSDDSKNADSGKDDIGYYSVVTCPNVWSDIKSVFNMAKEWTGFNTQKPEKLIQRIIEASSKEGEIVLDFCLGSGTTCVVAHKMKRQYIGVEQMDYINEITVPRLQKVINGEQGGISKEINWQGGGNFIYAELMEYNKIFVDKILNATSIEELQNIWKEIEEQANLNYKVELDRLKEGLFGDDSNEFNNLTLQKQKEALINSLDMNQLYVNYSEIDDEELNIPEDVKQFNKSFYGDGDE